MCLTACHRMMKMRRVVPSAMSVLPAATWTTLTRTSCHYTVVTRRRRRHATAASNGFFCVPFGGARHRARLPTVQTAAVALPQQ